MSWPPALAELKTDMRITDTRDDAVLQVVLDAAVAFVDRVVLKWTPPAAPPVASADVVLGTLRLAARWHARRRSPDALIEAAEFGTSRIPSFDSDIERLLKIGRYRKSVIA